MRNLSKSRKIVVGLTIEAMSSEGKSLARHDGKVMFVKEAVPGDVVDVEIYKKRKAYAEATPIRYHQYSPQRTQPFCTHFGVCGGCQWQHINYASQLSFKQQQVVDSLERIGKVALPEVMPIIASKKTQRYRNKLEFTFSNKKWLSHEQIHSQEVITQKALGFHVPRWFDRVVDIETCHLMAEPANELKNEIRAFALSHGHSFFDIRQQHGLLRTLMIRHTDAGELMVLIQFYEHDQSKINDLMNHLKHRFPSITSLLYVVNQKKNDTIYDQEVILFSGKDHIVEKMGDLTFKVGAKSFYQTHSAQAKILYDHIVRLADFQGNELVYDLYTGTGTIALYCAKWVSRMVGIEYTEEAVADAQMNAANNGIKNTEFYAGDIKEVLDDEFVSHQGTPQIIITDPPRAGMHPQVVQMILKIAPPKIIYVSCNPATQARDLALMDAQYQIIGIQPLDMFPQTHHVENIVILAKRANI